MLGWNRLRHLRHSPLAQRLLPPARWSYSRLLTSLGMRVRRGGHPFDPSRPTAVVVSHEATATGAPILALNLCQELSASHNVIVVLLRGGPLHQAFAASAITVIEARRSFVNRKVVQRALQQANPDQQPGFALVNSAVAAPLLEPLRGLGIPCLCLVHEFVTYIKPLEVFAEIGLWASRVVCSTPLTWNDVLRHCPHLQDVPLVVLPQGRCTLPEATTRVAGRAMRPTQTAGRDAEVFLQQLKPEALLVLGAGAVQPRKGVDLFVAMAQLIHQQAPDLPVHFAWIGSGYEPERDFSVSIWLRDQIERSGLTSRLTMLDESPAYAALMQRSSCLVVSSRLDPLPNVAIDAMLEGTPVLCFAEACGIADLLEQTPSLYSACVARYFNIADLAHKAMALLRSPERLQQVGQLLQQQAERWFDMRGYIQQLTTLGVVSAREVEQEQADLQLLLAHQLVQAEVFCPDHRLSPLALHQRYLLAWRSNIQPRKPFPGFHPGIYRERMLGGSNHADPLAHWHRHGQPEGPWLVSVLEPTATSTPLPQPGSVALHIHVFYPELLAPLLEQLGHNQVQPHLFVSYSQPELEPPLLQTLEEWNRSARLLLVPNRGRDIGPLLTELGQDLDRNYAFHGHLHTKRSALIDGGTAERWREFLMINLLGDARRPMADRILSRMLSDPTLGLVFPDDPGCLGWTANRAPAEALAERLQLPVLPAAINFPVGTMFWARRGALRSLYELGLTWNDYPEEPIGYDGTMLHAIERLLPQVCQANGYSYAVTHVPGFSR